MRPINRLREDASARLLKDVRNAGMEEIYAKIHATLDKIPYKELEINCIDNMRKKQL